MKMVECKALWVLCFLKWRHELWTFVPNWYMASFCTHKMYVSWSPVLIFFYLRYPSKGSSDRVESSEIGEEGSSRKSWARLHPRMDLGSSSFWSSPSSSEGLLRHLLSWPFQRQFPKQESPQALPFSNDSSSFNSSNSRENGKKKSEI